MSAIDGEAENRIRKILELMFGGVEDRVLSKKEIIRELDKDIALPKPSKMDNLCTEAPKDLTCKLPVSKDDLPVIVSLLESFNTPDTKWKILKQYAESFFILYDPNCKEAKSAVNAFINLFSTKLVKLEVKNKILLSNKKTWKWKDVLNMVAEGIKKYKICEENK
ncbi:MAG: hypothetical protein ACTSSJ_02575 [Candidatus Odinarchaeia archaeon]